MTRTLTVLATILALTAFSRAADPTPQPPPAVKPPLPAPTPPSPESIRIKAIGEKQALFKAEYDLRSAQLKDELSDLLIEKERIETELSVADARRKKAGAEAMAYASTLAIQAKTADAELKVALSELRTRKEKLGMEMALRAQENLNAAAKVKAEIAGLTLEIEQAAAHQAHELHAVQIQQKALAAAALLRAEENKARLADMAAETERLTAELAHAQKVREKELQEITAQTAVLMAKNANAAQLQAQRASQHLASMTDLQQEMAQIQAAMTLRDTRDAFRATVNRDIAYPAQPFVDGVLTISDRRIALNDVIMEGTADFVTERIHYFNNQSAEAPIFIVIDRSPGGSVMEGYRILKAMEASKAPIHVVIKSFAASMAATIATAADHSYAYPNAIMLHHQPSGMSWGNLTQQDEQMIIFKEWAKRLHATVADKMDVSMDEFYKQMYEKNSDGDWQEFADAAVKIGWVGHIANEIREEGVVKRPTDEAPEPEWFFFSKGTPLPDPKNDFVLLPRLKPFDYYFIYNPAGHYRWVE